MTPAQQRVEATGRWLAAAGGQASPGEIGAALGFHHRHQAEVIGALRTQGLVEGPRTQVALTAAGWARFAGVTGESAGEVLDRALAGWPQTHRAFVELMASAVIARHHLGAAHPEGHLGFMAIGPTGTGKSSVAAVVCHLFGWPLEEHLVDMPHESAGSLLGRREQEAGGGWHWEPAPMTRLPFVVLDEFDKADRGVQLQAWRYFQGRLRVRTENGVHELRPTPLLTANGDPDQVTRQEYRRRSGVLFTGAMAGRGREIGRLMRQLSPADRLDLGRLVPPARLDDGALAVLEAAEEALTEAGREEFDLPGLELAALGRCALLGDGADQELAAYATAVAYLQVTETRRGLVRERWGPDLAAMRQHFGADVDGLLAAIERGREGQRQAREAVQEGRQRQARAELTVLEQGATLAARCRQLVGDLDSRKLSPERRPEAAGLRTVLRTVANRAAAVSTAASLREVQQQAEDPLARGAQLVAAEAAGRQQRLDDAAETKRQAEQDRRAARKALEFDRIKEAAARQQRAEQLAAVVAAAKPLEALYRRKTTAPVADPLTTLTRLRVPGYDQPLLSYVSPPPPPPAKGLRRLLQALPQGHWQVIGSGARFGGTRTSCPALATWGPGTRAVLAPTLAALHAQEDQLRTGRQRQRPNVDPDADAAAAAVPARILTGPRAARQPGAAVARR